MTARQAGLCCRGGREVDCRRSHGSTETGEILSGPPSPRRPLSRCAFWRTSPARGLFRLSEFGLVHWSHVLNNSISLDALHLAAAPVPCRCQRRTGGTKRGRVRQCWLARDNRFHRCLWKATAARSRRTQTEALDSWCNGSLWLDSLSSHFTWRTLAWMDNPCV